MENVFLNLLHLFLFFLNIFSTDFIQSEKPFSIDCINIYLFSVFFSIDFARWKREPLVSERKSLTTKLLAPYGIYFYFWNGFYFLVHSSTISNRINSISCLAMILSNSISTK